MNRLSKSSKIWMHLFLTIQCLLLCAVGATQLHAQQGATAMLTGTVVDPVGSSVPSATVTARNEASGAVNKATSDAGGKFVFRDLTVGNYTIEVSSPGFALASRSGVQVSAERTEDISVALTLGSVNDAITVEANTSGSIAAQSAPMDGLLEARSARTEVTPLFIQNFTSPNADFGELVEMAPGTYSISTDGVGLGQDKTYFRGFPDGDYDIDFDGVPFYDTNTPTHHTWSFFPDPWTGSVDFDRSPGSAATIGPTPFGGSIHLLSPDMSAAPIYSGSVSYGSWNTKIFDVNIDSGMFAGKKSNLLIDIQHMTSDGYEIWNDQTRNAGSLKYQYKFSENNVLTGYSGVVWLDSNTQNSSPTRGQIAQYGYNFYLSNDSNAGELYPQGSTTGTPGSCINNANCLYPLYYKFETYHVPTDFEYVDWTKQWGGGWQTDFKPYTLSYYNDQYYNTLAYNANGTFKSTAAAPIFGSISGVDKLNSYRKYGETASASEVSKYGILRTGLWYEWATTNRYQIPSNPLLGPSSDTVLPNFHERFYTNSLQPYVEYEYHVTQRVTLTAGFKFSYFNQTLTQFQDNGKTVGCLGGVNSDTANTKLGTCIGGVPYVIHGAGYNSYLPSLDANVRIKNNWSVYGQYGTGTIIPPSGVFDVTGANVSILPKPTGVYTFQTGTVLKLKQVTLNADVYYTHFQNAYSAVTDPNNTSADDYISQGDAVTKGFEGEANIYITHGLSFYVNGTAGKALYVSGLLPTATGGMTLNPNFHLWVANTPSDTETFALTYHQKHFEVGVFDKRIGPMWNDNSPYNQVIPINPFSVTNFYFNFMLRNGSHFDQTKVRLSVNNLFDNHNIVGVTQVTAGPTYNPQPGDQLTIMAGRSFTLTITPAFSPKR